MIYKKIIKRGIKDLSFIDNFLKEKLQDNEETIINISSNVYSKILCRYARSLEYHVDRFNTNFSLFFNDEIYSFEVLSRHNGKYGEYYKLHIVDIEKFTAKQIEKRLLNLEANKNKELKYLYLRLFQIQANENINPFKLNLYLNETNKRIINEFTNSKEEIELINKIECIEG